MQILFTTLEVLMIPFLNIQRFLEKTCMDQIVQHIQRCMPVLESKGHFHEIIIHWLHRKIPRCNQRQNVDKMTTLPFQRATIIYIKMCSRINCKANLLASEMIISVRNNLSNPKLQRHHWSVETDKKFHLTRYNGCNYLSILGFKLFHMIHTSKRVHAMVVCYVLKCIIFV